MKLRADHDVSSVLAEKLPDAGRKSRPVLCSETRTLLALLSDRDIYQLLLGAAGGLSLWLHK